MPHFVIITLAGFDAVAAGNVLSTLHDCCCDSNDLLLLFFFFFWLRCHN